MNDLAQYYRPEGPVLRCGSCGSGNLRRVLDLGTQPTPQAHPGRENNKYPLRLVECPNCTLVQLDYIAPQDEVFGMDYPYTTGNTKALRDHFAEQARRVAGMLSDGDLVIDIGGNDGTMLRSLNQEFMKADGPRFRPRPMLIEPTDQAKRCDEPGIEVVQDYFTAGLASQIRETHGPAKVITCSNVFGHIPDPHDFLDGITTLLDGEGTFLIDNQDWYNVIQDLQIDTIYHEHLRFYTPTSLGWLLARHGLMITSWNRIDMHGGSFRALAVKEKQHLQARAMGTASKLKELMVQARKEGPIYAVTAPTRATPLVNYAGLGRYLAFACEVAGSDKIGALIPGTSVRIVDEKLLFDEQPPHALILAWDIAEGLIPVLRRKGYRGRFIIPLPEPRFTDG